MNDRPPIPRHWLVRIARPAATTAFAVLLLYIAVAMMRLLDHKALPDPRVHTMLVALPAAIGIVFLILACYSDLRRRISSGQALILRTQSEGFEQVLETQTEIGLHLTRTFSRLFDELAHRSDIPTDRIVAIVNERLQESDRDRDLLVAALAEQLHRLEGQEPEHVQATVLELPDLETREAIRRVNRMLHPTELPVTPPVTRHDGRR